MRFRAALAAGLLVLSSSVRAQEPALVSTPAPEPPIVVYKIELLPTGFGFAMEEPKLEGDVYVFRSLPERTISRRSASSRPASMEAAA